VEMRRQSAEYRKRVDAALERCLPDADEPPQRLHEAMRYAVLGGGKRVRAILVYASADAVGGTSEGLDAPACAVELIHAYSLVHDDLPAMDDDELRRGRPTCHRAFDEATALLAGDALQSLAFEVLSSDPSLAVTAERRCRMLELLSKAVGSRGMAGGQAIDLGAVGRSLSLEELEQMHLRKTGALIRASILLGALCASADDASVEKLDEYARCVGLAFQIQDDVLDLYGDKGRDQRGSDIAEGKRSVLAVHALENAAPHDAGWLLEVLDKERGATSSADVERVAGLFERLGSLSFAVKEMHARRQAALAAIGTLKQPRLSAMMQGISETVLEPIRDLV